MDKTRTILRHQDAWKCNEVSSPRSHSPLSAQRISFRDLLCFYRDFSFPVNACANFLLDAMCVGLSANSPCAQHSPLPSGCPQARERSFYHSKRGLLSSVWLVLGYWRIGTMFKRSRVLSRFLRIRLLFWSGDSGVFEYLFYLSILVAGLNMKSFRGTM